MAGQPQQLTLAETIIPVVSLTLLIALSYYPFGDAGAKGPNQVALTVATMIAVALAWSWGCWNSCGAYMSATLGVATLSYAPYAVFNIASPLVDDSVCVYGFSHAG